MADGNFNDLTANDASFDRATITDASISTAIITLANIDTANINIANIDISNIDISNNQKTFSGNLTGNLTQVGELRGGTLVAPDAHFGTMKTPMPYLAEHYIADKKYKIGDVLCFGGPNEVFLNNKVGDTRVAGVVVGVIDHRVGSNYNNHIRFNGTAPDHNTGTETSVTDALPDQTQQYTEFPSQWMQEEYAQMRLCQKPRLDNMLPFEPGILLSALLQPGDICPDNLEGDEKHVVAIATLGRVLCKVSGIVRKGDLMVTDGRGRAVSARAQEQPGPDTNRGKYVGAILGKALEDSLEEKNAEIYISLRHA